MDLTIELTREYLKNNICSHNICLEIGPYHSPILDHNNTNNYSIDILTKEELIENADKDPNIKSSINIPETNYLLTEKNDYDIEKCVDRTFDMIVSSHNIEHLPNLIKELNKYRNILNDNGKIIAFIPDCNFEFDYLRNITSLSDIIDDYYMNRNKPSFKSLIDFKLLYEPSISTINLWNRHLNNIKNEQYTPALEIKSKKDIDNLFKECKSKYIDTHNYTFTSKSFEKHINWLNEFKFINLHIEKIEHTKKYSHEFCVVLSKKI